MSAVACPDWQSLVASRERLAAQPGSGAEDLDREWRRALDHRALCEGCRRASAVADPLLLFRDLAPLDLDDSDIAQMQQRVAGALRWVEAEDDLSGTPGRRRVGSRWTSGLVAATLFFALAWGAGWHGTFRAPARSLAEAESTTATTLSRELGPAEAMSSVIEHLFQMPSVEADAEVTLLVDGESFELVQLGALGH